MTYQPDTEALKAARDAIKEAEGHYDEGEEYIISAAHLETIRKLIDSSLAAPKIEGIPEAIKAKEIKYVGSYEVSDSQLKQ
jgi:hypothetical protein